MRWLFLAAIRFYWAVAPASLRARCIFRISCSRYVHDATAARGCLAGITGLRERMRRCRPGYGRANVAGRAYLILRDGTLAAQSDIAPEVWANTVAVWSSTQPRLGASSGLKVTSNAI
jgi:putative component of membrane protein insertase Oxa1/YidC/SpoIIIJ protein YidD